MWRKNTPGINRYSPQSPFIKILNLTTIPTKSDYKTHTDSISYVNVKISSPSLFLLNS